MKGSAIFLMIMLATLMGLALCQSTETFVIGWRTSLQQLIRLLPILAIAMLIAGFTEILLPHLLNKRQRLSSAKILLNSQQMSASFRQMPKIQQDLQ